MLTFEDKQAQSVTPVLKEVLNGAQVLTTSEPHVQSVSSVTGIKSENKGANPGTLGLDKVPT